jgi:hypothetical protein
MNTPATDIPPSAVPPKKGMGVGAMIATGCGVVVLIVILLCGIGGFAGYRWVTEKVATYEKEFVAKGMTAAPAAQALTITKPPTKPTYYKAQVVSFNLTEPVTVEIGVVAQVIEVVQGEFAENVYFRGQVVTLNPSAKFAKEVNVECQVVDDRGATIAGGLTGTYSAKK